MKTIEEKAKAYDEALEKAKKLYEKGTITESIGYIFPELEKSEDEKIRKSIIENLKGNMYRADGDYDLLNKQISWLEKQGKKTQGKSALETVEEEKVDNANKVKPKFHEGEWIDQNGLSTSLEYGTVDENAHLWDTTKDAKDGDVLVII